VNDLQLDALALRWRGALDLAADTLVRVGRTPHALYFTSGELRARASQLDRERGVTERELEQLARATHTHLHRRL
jgi:cytosine/adenosine deaminase-related metal-dependent hydrolase